MPHMRNSRDIKIARNRRRYISVFGARIPGTLAEQRDVAVPAALQAHLLREDARAQLVLFAEVNEPYARSVQLFDQLYLQSNTKYVYTWHIFLITNERHS